MSRKHDIINELECDYGIELSHDFDEDGLCDGDTCRHSECECWATFEAAVEANLMEQRTERDALERSMKALYDGEVTAGIHRPSGKSATADTTTETR